MTPLLDTLSAICLLLGSVLCITGGIGLLRLPDFFARVHAAGLTETMAAPLLLTGVMLQMEWSLDLVKMLLIIVFVLATNPTASHSMAKAALHGGQKPAVSRPDSAAKGDGSSKA